MCTPLASVLWAAAISADHFPVSLFMASSMLKPDNLRAAASCFGVKPFCTLRMACHVVGQRLMVIEFDDISSHATLKEIVFPYSLL